MCPSVDACGGTLSPDFHIVPLLFGKLWSFLFLLLHFHLKAIDVSTRSLFQYGLIPNGGPYFQQGMSLKASIWVDHYPHGDRHERTTIEHGGAITRLFKRHAGGAICAPEIGRA